MYAKIFGSLWDGSLRGEPDAQLVFIFMCAKSDKDGICDIHPSAIRDATGLTEEEVTEAIQILEAPDPESRSPEERGARIARIDEHREWGWFIVNHARYRDMRDMDSVRAQNRERTRRWRAKKAGDSGDAQSVPM